MFLHASHIQSSKAKQAKKKEQLYQCQLEKCCNAIQESCMSSAAKEYIFFTVPYILAGEPIYNFTECITYLKDKLKERGFYRKRLVPGNVLFISWSASQTSKNPLGTNDTSEIILEFDPNDPESAKQLERQLARLRSTHNSSG